MSERRVLFRTLDSQELAHPKHIRLGLYHFDLTSQPARAVSFDPCRRLQREVREQRQGEKPQTTDGAAPCNCQTECSRRPLGANKACQTDEAIAPPAEAGALVVHQDAFSRACASCSTCGVDPVVSITDVANHVSTPTATTALEEEAEKRIAAALASAAVAQVRATAWASAFSAATQLFHAALVSLCDEATGGSGEDDGRHAFGVPLLTGTKASGSNMASNSAVVPWVPGEAKTDAATALQALRDNVQSAVEGIRLTAGHAARKMMPPASNVTTIGSQTVAEPPAAVVPVVSRNTKGSQADEEPKRNVLGARQHDAGVQAGGRPNRCNAETFSGGGGAPAWEGDIDQRCLEGDRVDGDGEPRIKQADTRVEELERTAGALSQALQRAEAEKKGLEQMLIRRFEHEKVCGLVVCSFA